MWRYEAKTALIDSPGIFLGVGSSILLPDDNQKARIWNSTLLVQTAGTSSLPGTRFQVPPTRSIGSGYWIESVFDDGKLIKLQDGSLWEVSPLDAIDSALWLPMSGLTIIEGDDPSYPYKLVNTDDNEIVNAKPISK